jgi:hypothetical protein
MHTQYTLFCYCVILLQSVFTQAAVLQVCVCGMVDQSAYQGCTVINTNSLCNSAGELLVSQVINLCYQCYASAPTVLVTSSCCLCLEPFM